MFRRKAPARGRQGFARSRPDITSLGERMGDIFRTVRGDSGRAESAREDSASFFEQPPAREVRQRAVSAPPAPSVAELEPAEPFSFNHSAQPIRRDQPREARRETQREVQRELPREPARQERRASPNGQSTVPLNPPQSARANQPFAVQSFANVSGNGVAPARRAPRPGYLAIHGVEKSFGSRHVVRGVSIYVRRGEAVGLLGPNGAGKTTVFYMITGLIKADRGRVELDGHDVTAMPMYQRARLGIGYLPQEASIFRGLSVEENILAVLEVVEPNRRKREMELNSLLEEFNITRLRKSPSIALSGGERRRVEIARALASRPSYMLLDEPFAGIDPIAVGDIQQLVRHLTNRGIGVLITDHNVRETLGLTDRAYIVYAGEVLTEGSPEQIVNDPDVRRLYLGEEFRL
ncbi:MAG: LPS export ABC transporter ATP-binding protein [Bradyrhizobiaceae bacterium]|nr:MAG: LPS export ABC transporter ATP-binding protein [Bradyrhizobiaceae bacterium]